ncbi:MAG TPA: gliding motility-associated C-terminal domain-containing protein, partial [Bacteroidales bacterium]|nr:gliding motility-associated C-terminal domain-containing protein [Bacteroidales bacterium]
QPAQALTASATTTNSTCGNANGAVNLTVSGGTPGYTFAWSNSADTEDLANVATGTYSVTITDDNSCSTSYSFNIYMDTAQIADAGPDQDWCNVHNTFLTGNEPAGTTSNWLQISGPNSVVISPVNSEVASVSGMIPGTYQFVYTLTSVYPAGNCVTTDTMTVVNYALPSTSYAGPDQVLCLDSGSTTATIVSGNIPTSGYGVWEQVLGPTTAIIGDSLSATTMLSNLAAGEYGFNWVIYSGPCEPHYDYIHITINAGPTADAGPDGQTCQGVAYALSGATASNYQSVSWTSSGTGVFSNPISQSPTYTPSPADVSTGYVVLTLTASGTAPCPARSDSMVLTINANPVLICPPDIAVAADLSSCTALVVDTLTGIAVNTTCVASITNSFNATDDASGTYPAGTTIVTWTITYADGTVDTCNQTITVYSPVVANLDISATQEDTPVVVDVLSNDTDCDSNINPGTVNTGCPACTLPANGTITIDPLTGAVTYTPDANFYGTDTLIYEVCDSGLPVSCDTALVIITVTPVNDPPVVEDSTVTIPPDSTIVICLPITDVDGPMPFSLSATGCVQNGTATAVVNGNLVCITYTPDSAWTGIDTVCVTICDGLGSCDTGYLIINVIPDTSQSVVIGVAKTITEVIVNTDHSYEVHYSVIAENLGNTMLTDVALFENLSNTFPLPTTFSISVPPVATGTLIANTAFDGVSDTNLLLPSSTLATGAADTVTFAVKIVVDGYFGPFDNVVTGIGENNGIFTTDTSDNGVITDANGNNNPNEPGENDPTILVLSPDPEIGLAKELVNVTEQYDGSYIVVFNLTVENLGNDTLYNVQVTDDLSQAFPSPATFQVVSAPVATGTLTANDSYNGVTDINLLDNTASMLDPGQTEHIQFKVRVFTHSVRTRTFYNIAVTEALGTMGIAVNDTSTEGTITDINGNGIANEELENNPTPIELKPFPIRIPDGFSPNGDDINDFFVIPNIENYPDCELSIYNRWGNLIYRKSSYDNSWDGTPNVGILLTGKQKVQPGTYYYILDFNYEDMEPAKGYVVVQY